MDKDYLERLQESFDLENFKKIYVEILKFVNNYDDYKTNEAFMVQLFEVLENNREKLVFGEKEKLLNETVVEVYHKIDFFDNSDFMMEKSELFFKRQICELFSRELPILTSFLENKKFHKPLINLISFFFNHFQVKIREQIQELIEYYHVKILTPKQLKTLVNPLFDRFPIECLTAIIDVLEDELRPKRQNEILYQILEDFSEIFPEIYYDYLSFFLESLDLDQNIRFKELVAQIIHNVVKNLTGLFILNYFDILSLLNRCFSLNNKKIIYYLEMSLKSIFRSEERV